MRNTILENSLMNYIQKKFEEVAHKTDASEVTACLALGVLAS